MPDAAPPSPSVDWRPASPRYVRARLVTALVVTPVPIIVGTVLAVQLSAWWWLLVAPFALGLLNILLLSRHYVAALGYAECDDEILVRSGRLSRSTVLLPYGRLQHVTIAEGIIDSRFGLAKLSIHTAASDSTDIPGLEVAEAKELRTRLVARSRSRDDGL